jgi:outer membrane protein W
MKRVIVLLLFVIASSSASAQFYDKMFFVGWNVNAPLVNTDYAGKTSTHGARVGYRELIRENIAVGIDLTWATYKDFTPRQTYYNPGGAVTTDFYNYANNYAALLTGDYYFRSEKKVMPYVGLGAGLTYNNYKRYYNVYSGGKNSFGFITRPQAGVYIKFDEKKNWAINAGVHFEFSTAKSHELGYSNFMNAGFELGLVFLQW